MPWTLPDRADAVRGPGLSLAGRACPSGSARRRCRRRTIAPPCWAITASASSGVRQPCSPTLGLRTRSCECWPPRQWIVRTTSRVASSTSAMMSATRARRSCWRARIVTPGAFHAAARSSARRLKSGVAAAGAGRSNASSRAAQASTRRSAVSQLLSSCAAMRRLSGSQAA